MIRSRAVRTEMPRYAGLPEAHRVLDYRAIVRCSRTPRRRAAFIGFEHVLAAGAVAILPEAEKQSHP